MSRPPMRWWYGTGAGGAPIGRTGPVPESLVVWLGAMSVMASYNEVDGVPSHANRWLLQDVLRAIRLVRSRAAEFGLRPDRIGVMGASAGGHVAASAATLFDADEKGNSGWDIAAYAHRAIHIRDGQVEKDVRRAAPGNGGDAIDAAFAQLVFGGVHRLSTIDHGGATADHA